MAFSRIIQIGDGVTTQIVINFPLGYISKSDITVRVGSEVDGLLQPVYRTITWINDGLINVEGGAAGVGIPYVVTRTVSKTTLVHNYQNGASIIEQNLDDSNKQNMMSVHEVLDGRFGVLQQDFDFGTFKGINAGDPALPQDLATKAYVDSIAIMPNGNVPPPTLGNVGMFLKATAAGVWAWAAITVSDVVGAAKASVAQIRAGTTDDYLITPLGLNTLRKKGSDVASIGTLVKPADANLGAYHVVTGNIQIDNIWAGTVDGEELELWFTGIPIVTAGGNIIPPSATTFQVIAGDVLRLRWKTATTKWQVTGGMRATGAALFASAPVVRKPLSRRQTVLAGPLTAAGTSNFGGATGGTTVTMSGTLVVAAANGSDIDGSVDRIGTITNAAWTGLNVNGSMFLYVDVNADGTCTPVIGTLTPIEQFNGVPSVTPGQFTFNIQEMKGYVGSGAAAPQTYRVKVGAVTVAGGVVTQIFWFATLGRYTSAFVATLPAVSTATAITHTLGTTEIYGVPIIEIECTTTDLGYAVGERLRNASTNSGGGGALHAFSIISIVAAQFATAQTNSFMLIPKAGGAVSALTVASWKYRVIMDRGW